MYHGALSGKLANSGEDLKNEDLKDIQELRQGNGGSVEKVEHTPAGQEGMCVSRLHEPLPSVLAYDQYLKLTITRGLAHLFHPTQIMTHARTDRVDRRKTVDEETDPAGTSDHARLQFAVHHFVLRRVRLGSQYLHLHGIYGQGLVGRDLQVDWTHRHRRRGECRVGRAVRADVLVRCPSDHSPR